MAAGGAVGGVGPEVGPLEVPEGPAWEGGKGLKMGAQMPKEVPVLSWSKHIAHSSQLRHYFQRNSADFLLRRPSPQGLPDGPEQSN